jgi:Tfp pilus assembly protein PilN
MVKLNLLPAKVREAELLRLVFIAGIGVYLLALGLVGWRYNVSVKERLKVDVQIEAVKKALLPLKAIADEVDKLTTEQKEQKEKKDKLGELAKHQAYLLRVLDALPDFMQGGQVWLTKLDQNVDKGQRRIMLEGKAHSVEAWADFYNNLESQNLVSELKVEGDPSAAKDGQRNIFQFKVSFVMKEPQ